jgi:hypothetical protein
VEYGRSPSAQVTACARKNPIPAPRAALAKLRADIDACGRRIEQLERAVELNIRRMGAMQAEIDHLRSTRKQG